MDKQTKLKLLEQSYKELLDSGIVHTQKEFADKMEYNSDNISSAFNGNERFLTQRMVRRIVKKSAELLAQKKSIAIKSELTPKEYSSHIPVRVVTTKARAGYSDAYYADEYLEDMPTLLIEADKEYKGRYLAFEVDGDSMEPEYNRGDVVICREVPRANWQYKLHYEQCDFVIAHGTQGIMLKEITSHNVETGEIVCHSLNTEAHPDFTLNLREVAFLYNIVEHRKPGRKYRRRS